MQIQIRKFENNSNNKNQQQDSATSKHFRGTHPSSHVSVY